MNIEKAELHIHLEGTVTPATLRSLAKKNKISLEAPTQLFGYPPIPAPVLRDPFDGNFFDFIKLYVKISDCIKSSEDIVQIAASYAESAAAQKILVSEVYLTPTTLIALGCPESEIQSGLLQAEELASSRFGTRLRWIFDVVRNAASDGFDTVDLATRMRDAGAAVHAVGLAGLEAGHPAARFQKCFELAREREFRILAHAGETAGPESIWETLRLIGPERIGHGVQAVQDPKLMRELIAREITLEISPWSNICLGVTTAENHPLKEMVDAGLKIVLAADDPGIFGRNLDDNYAFAAQQGLTELQLRAIAAASIQLANIS